VCIDIELHLDIVFVDLGLLGIKEKNRKRILQEHHWFVCVRNTASKQGAWHLMG